MAGVKRKHPACRFSKEDKDMCKKLQKFERNVKTETGFSEDGKTKIEY